MNWFAERLFLLFATLMTIAIPVALVLQWIWGYLWKKGKIKLTVGD